MLNQAALAVTSPLLTLVNQHWCWVLIGLHRLPNYVRDALDDETRYRLIELRRLLSDQGSLAGQHDTARFRDLAAAVNGSGGWWPAATDFDLCQVPTLWGLYAYRSDLAGEDDQVTIAACKRLIELLELRIGWPYAPGLLRCTDTSLKTAWCRFERALGRCRPVFLFAFRDQASDRPNSAPVLVFDARRDSAPVTSETHPFQE